MFKRFVPLVFSESALNSDVNNYQYIFPLNDIHLPVFMAWKSRNKYRPNNLFCLSYGLKKGTK